MIFSTTTKVYRVDNTGGVTASYPLVGVSIMKTNADEVIFCSNGETLWKITIDGDISFIILSGVIVCDIVLFETGLVILGTNESDETQLLMYVLDFDLAIISNYILYTTPTNFIYPVCGAIDAEHYITIAFKDDETIDGGEYNHLCVMRVYINGTIQWIRTGMFTAYYGIRLNRRIFIMEQGYAAITMQQTPDTAKEALYILFFSPNGGMSGLKLLETSVAEAMTFTSYYSNAILRDNCIYIIAEVQPSGPPPPPKITYSFKLDFNNKNISEKIYTHSDFQPYVLIEGSLFAKGYCKDTNEYALCSINESLDIVPIVAFSGIQESASFFSGELPSSSSVTDDFSFPVSRPDFYFPDFYWNEETKTWNDIEISGGGRYKQQLVLINEQGQIYVGDI